MRIPSTGAILLILAGGLSPLAFSGCGDAEQKTGAVLETRPDMEEAARASDEYFDQQAKAQRKKAR